MTYPSLLLEVSQCTLFSWVDLAKLLVDSLLVHNHLLRATAVSALQSQWINSELEELEALYECRITATPDDTT